MTFSQKLLEKYKIPYFSIDHLKMGLVRGDINCSFTPEDRNITQLINEHEELRNKCRENCVEYFEIDNDYEKEIQRVYDFIENSRSKMEGTV